MKSNGALAQQLTTVLKKIVREVQESVEKCRSEGQQVYKHHRMAAKNIQQNLRDVEKLLGEDRSLRALYQQAKKELQRLNRLIQQRKSPSHEQLVMQATKASVHSPLKQIFISEGELRLALKKNRLLELEIEVLKDTISELTQDKSNLLQQVHELENDAVMTAANLGSLSTELAEEQLLHEQKRQLIVKEIDELRSSLSEVRRRNETLVLENNQLQTERHQLMQLQLYYKQKFDQLLRRVDTQIAGLQQMVTLEKLETERSLQKCSVLQKQMDEAYAKLQSSEASVEALLTHNQNIESELNQKRVTRSQHSSAGKENAQLRNLSNLRLQLAMFKQTLN